MGNVQVGIPLATVTYTASSAAANRPATNVGLLVWPRRTWRSTTSGGTQWIQAQFPAATALAAFFLGGCNFPTVNLRISNDPTFASGGTILFLGVAVPFNRRVNQRRVWLDLTGNGQSTVYVRAEPTGTPDGGAAYYEISQLAGFNASTVITLDCNPGAPNKYVRKQAATRLPFLSGSEDVNADGSPYLETTWANDHWDPNLGAGTLRDQLATILDLGLTQPFVIFENQGKPENAALVRRFDDMPFEDRVTYFSAPLPMREPA